MILFCLLLINILVHLPGLSTHNSEIVLRQVNSCTCPGQDLVFECTVVGDGGTYWQGRALQNCSGGRLLVRHSQFDNGRNTTCGSTRPVVGLPFSRTNNSYTTQLIIFASQDLNGTTIACATDSGRNISESEIILQLCKFSDLLIITNALSSWYCSSSKRYSSTPC